MRQLFCLHRETHCRSQPLALVFLLFAPLSLLFDMYWSDFVFGVQLVFFFVTGGIFICFRLYSRFWIFFWFSCCRFVNLIRRVAVWRVYFRFPTSHVLKNRFFCARINFVVYSQLHTLPACLSWLLYPTVLSVFINILAGISHAPGHTARFSLTFASSMASW